MHYDISVCHEISCCVYIIGIKGCVKLDLVIGKGRSDQFAGNWIKLLTSEKKKSILFDFRRSVFSTSAVQHIFPASQVDHMQQGFHWAFFLSILYPCLLPLYSTFIQPLHYGGLCLYTAAQRFVNSANQQLPPCLLQVYLTVSIPGAVFIKP